MILTTWFLRIDFFEDVIDFYYFAVKFFVRDIISDFSSIAWFSSLEKNDFWTQLWSFNFCEHLLVKDHASK